MVEPGEAAERYLLEQEVVAKGSGLRRQILGCVACRWNASIDSDEGPQCYGFEIMRCTGIMTSVIYHNLGNIERAGLLAKSAEDVSGSRPSRGPRQYYGPSETVCGRAFADALDAPEQCHLHKKFDS